MTDHKLTKAEIQRLRSLRDTRERETLGLFAIEGEKVVAELLGAKFPFVEIYGTADWEGGKTREITSADMARISHFPTPSAVFAVGPVRREPLAAGALDHGLTLALDAVQDPGNVGTLLRIADWFGLDRVVLSPGCADLYSQKVINASMGSFARVNAHTADLGLALAGLRAPVLGCELAGKDVHEVPPPHDAVIVIGSEGRGLSEATRKFVTQAVTIPRYGRAESLNAAVAAAIVCDHLRSERRK